MTHSLRIEAEDTGQPCGFDYESFNTGFDCPDPATKAVVEEVDGEEDFHVAHLCEEHAKKVMDELTSPAG
jgi:hypothetical protein